MKERSALINGVPVETAFSCLRRNPSSIWMEKPPGKRSDHGTKVRGF